MAATGGQAMKFPDWDKFFFLFERNNVVVKYISTFFSRLFGETSDGRN
jgi:hypothetical protein